MESNAAERALEEISDLATEIGSPSDPYSSGFSVGLRVARDILKKEIDHGE